MESGRWTIREARGSDLGAVKRLLAQSDLPEDGLEDGFPGAYVVAESDGADEPIVGTAGLETHGASGLLRSVAVAPDRRGSGIGDALVRNQLDRARAQGLGAVYLLTVDASRYFERFGFGAAARESAPAEIRQAKQLSSCCCSGATFMTLSLADAAPSPREAVRARYGEFARQALVGSTGSCCGSSSSAPGRNPITSDLYRPGELGGIPEKAVRASLGCGNPTALAELRPGEIVLDLGSGGGIDVLLSARRVGPQGKAYGLDMTDDMLALARENQRKAGVTNVEFLKGEIEAVPLPDRSVDVIISNCVINLSTDKRRVLAEAFRVLRPGGRFAISDIVARRNVPAEIRRSLELWIGCIAGSLEESEYLALLRDVGFADVSIEPTRIYREEDARAFFTGAGLETPSWLGQSDGAFMSAFVRARKPGA